MFGKIFACSNLVCNSMNFPEVNVSVLDSELESVLESELDIFSVSGV